MTIRQTNKIKPKQKAGILWICAAISVYSLNLIAIGPVVARIIVERGIANTEAGLMFTSHFIGFIIFSLIGAILAEKVGKKRIIVHSLFIFGFGFLMFSIFDIFWLECLIMFVLGGAGGIVECLGSSLAADINPQNPEYAVNRVQIFFSVGAMLSPLLIALSILFVPFWKVFYMVLALYSFIVAFFMGKAKIEVQMEGESTQFKLRDLRTIVKEPGFIIMCFCMLAYTGSEVGVWGWLTALIQQTSTLSIFQSSLFVSLFWLFMGIGRVISGWLLPRLGAKKTVAILAAISAILTLATGLFANSNSLIWLIAGIGLGCSSQFPLITGIGSRLTTLPSGVAITILMVSGNIGSSLIPLTMGAIGDTAGLEKSLIIPVIMFSIICLVMIVFTIRKVKAIQYKQEVENG